MKVYRIRDKDGRYSSGGQDPDFTKAGKTWANIGHVKNHIRQFMGRYRISEIYDNAEIVEIEVEERDLKTLSINEMMIDMLESDLLEHQKRADAYPQSTYYPQAVQDTKDKIALLRSRDEAR